VICYLDLGVFFKVAFKIFKVSKIVVKSHFNINMLIFFGDSEAFKQLLDYIGRLNLAMIQNIELNLALSVNFPLGLNFES